MQVIQKRGTWFDAQCEEVTKEKNEAYKKMQQKFGTRRAGGGDRERRIMEKRVHRRKKREWMKVEMERLELLNSQNDTRKLYKALNNARKTFKPRVTLYKDEVGDIRVISDKQGILARWVRHFDKLLNGDPAAKKSNEGEVQRNVQEFEVREVEETEAPTLDEVGNALEKLKNNKAPGTDNLLAELIK
jgi:hypothetical protein